MNRLDRAIAWISPGAAARRAEARARAHAYDNARMVYDGATRGRRAEGWRVVSTDANAETRAGAARLRDVARDMVRNNPHAAKAVMVIKGGIVGNGIIPTIVGTAKGAKGDKQKAELEALLVAHFETTACDADGVHDLYGLQALATAAMVQDGEVFIRCRLRRASDRLPLPFQLQVLEADFLDVAKDGPQKDGTFCIMGVEYDGLGKRLAYWLFDQHPGAFTTWRKPQSTRVPANLVAHIFRKDRPQQGRGVSWFAPVVLRLRDRNDFADTQLIRQKIAACFAAFIKVDGNAPLQNPKDVDAQGKPLERVEPGIIERLGAGEEVTFGSPPQVSGYAEFINATDHDIAAGLGISYESLTGDLRQTSFSSGRMGWIIENRNIEQWRGLTLGPQFLVPLSGWFFDAAALVIGRRYSASMKWTPPKREMINPKEEIDAARDAIRSGLSSRPHEQAKLGFDPIALDSEIEESNHRADAKGLIFDSDPRTTTQQGLEQGTAVAERDAKLAPKKPAAKPASGKE